jgi:hypothetical protein
MVMDFVNALSRLQERVDSYSVTSNGQKGASVHHTN